MKIKKINYMVLPVVYLSAPELCTEKAYFASYDSAIFWKNAMNEKSNDYVFELVKL